MAIRGGSAAERPEGQELVITRVFDAPRDLVFKAWTERDRMMRWWGPNGFTLPVCNIEVRWAGTVLILTAFLLSGYQAYGVAPRMERVKQSAASFEAALPDDSSRREFSRLHGISMVLNLAILLEGVALIVAQDSFRR